MESSIGERRRFFLGLGLLALLLASSSLSSLSLALSLAVDSSLILGVNVRGKLVSFRRCVRSVPGVVW